MSPVLYCFACGEKLLWVANKIEFISEFRINVKPCETCLEEKVEEAKELFLDAMRKG